MRLQHCHSMTCGTTLIASHHSRGACSRTMDAQACVAMLVPVLLCASVAETMGLWWLRLESASQVLVTIPSAESLRKQKRRAIQTGAVLSSPPPSEVQAVQQCGATAYSIGFLPHVCVCAGCAGHARVVGAPGRWLAAFVCG